MGLVLQGRKTRTKFGESYVKVVMRGTRVALASTGLPHCTAIQMASSRGGGYHAGASFITCPRQSDCAIRSKPHPDSLPELGGKWSGEYEVTLLCKFAG